MTQDGGQRSAQLWINCGVTKKHKTFYNISTTSAQRRSNILQILSKLLCLLGCVTSCSFVDVYLDINYCEMTDGIWLILSRCLKGTAIIVCGEPSPIAYSLRMWLVTWRYQTRVSADQILDMVVDKQCSMRAVQMPGMCNVAYRSVYYYQT